MNIIAMARTLLYRVRNRRLFKTWKRFRDYSMIPSSSYIANLQIARLAGSVGGAIVECGTWRGGMIAGIAEMVGSKQDYYLFDSFEGLPPAETLTAPPLFNGRLT